VTNSTGRYSCQRITAAVAGGARRQKRFVNKRTEGGVAAAKSLRKELVRLLAFKIKAGLVTVNPAEQSERVKVGPSEKSKGWHTWTEDEIDQYRAHQPLGSKARLGLEPLLWTGQRRGDAIRMGRQYIRAGFLDFGQRKTGKELVLPVAPQLLEAIVALPLSAKSHLCFLVNDYGKPFSDAGFGNRTRKWCDQANLPQCSAHGLRKAMQRRLAEIGMSNQPLKSVSGHSGDAEVALYTRAVDQKRMATDAIAILAHWEVSNRSARSDTKNGEAVDISRLSRRVVEPKGGA
jgi:integrase